MKKKKVAANIVAAVMLMGALSGCDLFVKDSARDMEQTVAKVNITKSEDFREEYGDKYDGILPELTIQKRELVAYFVNSGYSYISSGYSYEDTFNTLMTSMVNYKIIIQYAMVYFFENEPETYTVENYRSFSSGSDNDTYKILEYLLTTGEDDYKEETGVTHYEVAEYQLKQSINSAIDGREANYLATSETSSSTDETRTVPDGVDTEKEDYCDSGYTIYTGWNTPSASYEKQSGSTVATRKKGFSAFLNMLSSNNLLEEDETMSFIINVKGDADKGLENTAYYQSEMITQMQAVLSEKLTDAFEKKAEEEVTDGYLNDRYNKLLESQKNLYDKDVSTFESDISSMSDSSFVLYCPETADDTDKTRYGFVYNILLPFSSTQSYMLSQYQSSDNAKDALGNYTETYYNQRNALLQEVKGGDLRGPWINGSEKYAYIAEDDTYYNTDSNSNYLFFENNMKDSDRYEKIQKYLGQYPYNGTVEYDENTNNYKLTANKLSITDFLTEMEKYLNYALNGSGYVAKAYKSESLTLHGGDKTGVTVGNSGYASSYMDGDKTGGIITKNDKNETEVDYSRFVYYVGQIADANGETMSVNAKSLFEESDTNYAYKAMSAFNELQFAYSTDTGCLNTYLGYSVSRYSTSFVGEFEYAAKLAISLGVGTYTVCPSDYGWHIIYCTYTFDKGEIYQNIDWNNKTEENTFEYYYYETLKAGIVSDYQTILQNQTVNAYNNSACVTIYKNTYADYTSLKNDTTTSTES